MGEKRLTGKTILQEDYEITEEPYYVPVRNEVKLFKAAFYSGKPIALIGPTGCGKTALTRYMAYQLRKELIDSGYKQKFEEAQGYENSFKFPYIEIGCNEDTTANDLVGRKNIKGEWEAGPLYTGAKKGGLIVLDEIIEAREDTTVVIHSLTDDRRYLPVTKKGEILVPPKHFGFVICYNPGYTIISKRMKPSTAQRFVTIKMDYPPADLETKMIMTTSGADRDLASKLVSLAGNIRKSANNGTINLQEGVSTRLLNWAAEIYLTSQKEGYNLSLEDCVECAMFNSISTEDTNLDALKAFYKLL